MRALLLGLLPIAAAIAATPAEARSTSCATAIRQLDAAPLRSRAAIEQVGRAKAALTEGRTHDCLAHVKQARADERKVATRSGAGAYSGSSTPPTRYRGAYRDDNVADELNRRQLRGY